MKFRDVNKDLLELVKCGKDTADYSDSDSDASDDEGLVHGTPVSVPYEFETGPVKELLPHSELNLSAPALKDLLSDTPCMPLSNSVSPQPSQKDVDDDAFVDFQFYPTLDNL